MPTKQLFISLDIDPATNTASFFGDTRYVTQSGDIVLNSLSGSAAQVIIYISTQGYQFDANAPIYITDNPNNAGQPGPLPNEFALPALPLADTSELVLYDNNQGHKHYYFTLNLVDPNGVALPIDPIIVNN